MAIFVTEEMLEREVAMYLAERLKASPLEQGSLRRPHRQLDILLRLNGERLIVEMEVGEGWRKIVQGIAQANEYKEQLNADGIIALVYPPAVRRPVDSAEQVLRLALTTPVQALILSTFLNDHFANIKLPHLAERIAGAWANYRQRRVATVSHELIVNALRECVQLLSAELHQNRGLADPVMETMDITDNSDWFICQRFKGFDKVELMLGVKVDFDALNRRANATATHLAVGYRLDLATPGTCLTAFYSDRKVVPQQAFSSFHADPIMAKALCLWLNGVAFIVQILANRAETRGSFCNLTDEMLRSTLALTAQFFTEHNKDFADAFDRFRLIKWRSLLEQFEHCDNHRYELDSFLLRMLGFTDNEIAQWLLKVYRVVAQELRTLKEAMQTHHPEEDEETER